MTFPQGVAFDPISDIFMVTSSTTNEVALVNSGTQAVATIGVDPRSSAH